MTPIQLSFVIPVYNERDTLQPLADGIIAQMAEWRYELLFVDDGSTDGSRETLETLATAHPTAHIVRMRGNCGKSAALAAGFALAQGELVFTMDSDLQDDPREIPRFLAKLEEGYDVVCGWKAYRRDPWHKVMPSRLYNAFVAWLFKAPLHDVNCGYKLMRRSFVRNLRLYGEMHRLIPIHALRMNYRVVEIPVEHHPRRYGVSKFGFERFSRGAIDVLTMWFLSRYRHQPAHFFVRAGCFLAAAEMGLGTVAFVGWLMGMSAGLLLIICAACAPMVIIAALSIGLGLLGELVVHHSPRLDPLAHVISGDDIPPGNG